MATSLISTACEDTRPLSTVGACLSLIVSEAKPRGVEPLVAHCPLRRVTLVVAVPAGSIPPETFAAAGVPLAAIPSIRRHDGGSPRVCTIEEQADAGGRSKSAEYTQQYEV